jgi:hypothetical protein
MFEGIENVTLHLEGEDKIVVTNADYLKSLMKLLSETPSKTLGKYRYVIPLSNLESAHYTTAIYFYMRSKK